MKAKIQRPIEEKIKTVTVSETPSGKYFASILFEVEGENTTTTEGEIYGIDLGLKHFAVARNGEKVFLYDNPTHLAKLEKNHKGQQQKLTQKDDSNSRRKYRKVVAKVYVCVACAWRLLVSNSRQDFLHKHQVKSYEYGSGCGRQRHPTGDDLRPLERKWTECDRGQRWGRSNGIHSGSLS
nr:transposase [Argonema galeatum]